MFVNPKGSRNSGYKNARHIPRVNVPRRNSIVYERRQVRDAKDAQKTAKKLAENPRDGLGGSINAEGKNKALVLLVGGLMAMAGIAGCLGQEDLSDDKKTNTIENPYMGARPRGVTNYAEIDVNSSTPESVDGIRILPSDFDETETTYENHDKTTAHVLEVSPDWDGEESTLPQQTMGQEFIDKNRKEFKIEWGVDEAKKEDGVKGVKSEVIFRKADTNIEYSCTVEETPTTCHRPATVAIADYKAYLIEEYEADSGSSGQVSWNFRNMSEHDVISAEPFSHPSQVMGINIINYSDIKGLEEQGYVFKKGEERLGTIIDPAIGSNVSNWADSTDKDNATGRARKEGLERVIDAEFPRKANLANATVASRLEFVQTGTGEVDVYSEYAYMIGQVHPVLGQEVDSRVSFDNVTKEVVAPENITTPDGNETILSEAEYEQRRADGWYFIKGRNVSLVDIEVGLESDWSDVMNNSYIHKLLAVSSLMKELGDVDNTTAGYSPIALQYLSNLSGRAYTNLALQRPWYGGELMAWLHLLNESGIWDSGFIYVDYRGGVDPTEADDILLYVPKDYIDSQNRTVEDIEWEIRDAIRRINRGAIDGVIIGAEGEEIEPFLVNPGSSTYRRDGDYQNYPDKTEAFVPYQKMYRLTDLVNFEEY